jgi:cellulase/cellobiase CelA1
MSSTGIANYNVEISVNGGAWKLISTLPASQLSIDVTKSAATGWSSFRVSAVYSDGQTILGTTVLNKSAFGLSGQFN